MTQPIRIAVTGGAGQIAYSLLFRIGNGEVFGPQQPVVLQILEIPPAMDALRGRGDGVGGQRPAAPAGYSSFPMIPRLPSGTPNWAILVGGMPRGPAWRAVI